ncbi:polycystin-1-like protein 2 [Xenentodon cancila]
MCLSMLKLLILLTLTYQCSAEVEKEDEASCPERQMAFGGSCFEFVGVQHTFHSAQEWCEESGGHLAFIPDKDTQYFLEKHLDSEKDMWLGLAPSFSPNQPYSVNAEGPLMWLDGSAVTYSKWVTGPPPGAACAHILRNSDFRWQATRDCDRKIDFICQFESGRRIVCPGRNTTLQCHPDHVLMIESGFFGRKNSHYCLSRIPTITQHECVWMDVLDSVKAQCHGHHFCLIDEVLESFAELCPQQKSYLAVSYRCRKGLVVSVTAVAAVADDVTITVKCLICLPQKRLDCKLSTGDGHILHLLGPQGLEITMVHKYTNAAVFFVAVECTSSEMHITAQKIIAIQEPVTEIEDIRCYTGKKSFQESNCRVLNEGAFQIQIKVKSGTNVAYRIQSGAKLLAGLSVVEGTVPQNITVTPEAVKQLGPGCHHLTLYASNMVTYSQVSADLQVCILEKIAGLHASVLKGSDDCSDSPYMTLDVSLDRGEPVLLTFSLSGSNGSFSETREMNTKRGMFQIGYPVQESMQMKVRAWNAFSSLVVDVDMRTSCDENSVAKRHDIDDRSLSLYKKMAKQHVRVARASWDIIASPSNSVTHKDERIELSVTDVSIFTDAKSYRWKCDNNKPYYTTYIIETSSPTDDPNAADDANPPVAGTTKDKTSNSGSGSSSEQTTRRFKSFSCIISPSTGTILDAFNITCTTESTCYNCQYCFAAEGKHLLCSNNKQVKTVFLPLGDKRDDHNLLITATARNDSIVFSSTLTAQVFDLTENLSSAKHLSTVVQNAVAQLKNQDLLSGERIGQIISSVANKLNSQSNEAKKEDRQKLREEMLDIMIDTINEVPCNTTNKVEVAARGLTALVQEGTELNISAQVDASMLFANLSSSLLHMDVNKTDNKEELSTASSTIMEGVGHILDYSSSKNISDVLLDALRDVQSALLNEKETDEGPTVINQTHISMVVNRVRPEDLHKESVNAANSSLPTFSLPELPLNTFPLEETVDVRMLTFDKNPFSWNERGNISSLIGVLSLTTKNGSGISVENLSEDIEILLPRVSEEQVETSVLDLGNYSTTVINIPSNDTTLILKMVPSVDPLPFKLFLGYMEYPTEINHVAMTEMPLQGATQEERYTWLLDPKNLKGHAGVHYLVVRPIVGPGIKSINATLSITPITTSCKFWNESELEWSNSGCRVGMKSSRLVTQCLCNHLTFFGSSFFVTPNLVDPSRTAELFATFAQNPVVVCFVGALFLTYLLVIVWARRKDIKDTAKVKVTVLEDNDPRDDYCYLLSVSTGYRFGASTSSQVIVTLLGAEGNSEPHHLTDSKKPVFERGAVDMFLIATPFFLGELQGVRLWHDNSGGHPAWYVGNVVVQDLQTKQKWYFLCNSWLALDMGDCLLDKVFPVSTEMDLKRFSNLFFMRTTKDFSDGHLWFSVISRPPSSGFTCVQRVSCCFSLLLCNMLTSIMFYGIPSDPSDQVMDLGQFEFTWQQFMIGVQSSLIMFPVNLLIVSIFRNTRPRETSCCERKSKMTKTCQRESAFPTVSSQTSTSMNVNATLDTVIKDITTIAYSLSKTAKSNIPHVESAFGPGQEIDINAILTVVEDFIRQNNKAESRAREHPISTAEGIQKNSNKTRYLYRQLCHIDTELSLLDPSSFPNPLSYRRALQQVQGMKSLLENQLFTSSSISLDETTHEKPSTGDNPACEGSQKKRWCCCHGLLPWWFVFVGWLLVIATSLVSGYFTMLYGLKFGKDRSISWLVSMIVSFFQSLLLIQPLKVFCLAVFFALVVKKLDEENVQNIESVKDNRNRGECKEQQIFRREYRLYEPPPPVEIERMKKKKVMQQKAFALLREILTYAGFLWMLLLVAYDQRDPNAFFLNQHISNSFTGSISESMSVEDVFTWVNVSLLTNLFGEYPGFITDGNSKLVGNARLRQLRVQKDSCQIADSMLRLVPDCRAPYSWEVEDMGSYEPGWNHSVRANSSAGTSSPWKYQTQAQLRAQAVWGKAVIYRGGGFVVELGPDLPNASSTLEHLFRNKWLDMYTRAIFVEFTVYNANVNLFCIVTLLMETPAVGAFHFHSELQSVRLYQSTDGFYFFVMAAEIVYLLFILYYMFLQGKLMKNQRWLYFKNKWNLLELSIILLSWSAVAVFIKRTLLGKRDLAYYQNHKDQFASFYETAAAELVLQYLIAFLVLLATVKLWHLLRLNPKMHMITAALQQAWSDISSFLVIIVIILVAYSITSNVIYGWHISSYKTFMDSLLTLVSLQAGIFNYDEVLDSNPVLSGILFGSCIMFMTFVLLSLFISVILLALKKEQIHHKPSEEEEFVDLMLENILSLFGIRYGNKKRVWERPQ